MTSEPEQRATIWVDVEDFFDYFRGNPYPSGIQRLAFEIKRAMIETQASAGVRFARRRTDGGLREVAWADLRALMDQGRPDARPNPVPVDNRAGRASVQHFINGLPEHLRGPLFRAGLLQLQAGRKWREAARAVRDRRRSAAPLPPQRVAPDEGSPAEVQEGDCYLVLGAPWAVPGFAEFLARLKQRHGVAAYLLLYDLIPVRHPEWCTKPAVQLFERWLDSSLPLFDGLLAISRHTAADVEAYAQERGIRLAGPVRPVPIGTGLGEAPPCSSAIRPSGLPRPGTYALFVSTVEVRKNHALLFRVWRRLEEEVRAGTRPVGSVPTLVFAGRVGWLVADLLGQLENTNWLHGRVRLIPDPSDAELRALYRGCLFTVFPSWFEGWGLPVSESLAFGKPCLASSATALPEAGGDLCRYFDPDDVAGAHAAVASLLDTPGALAAWEDRVRREFRPVPWSATAASVLEAMRK